ncbi:MAG: rod shape-determining protein RodA [Desulfobacterales bacterium]|nr:rod shape-determining protein RodA [Desulfobacterales bacterium]
MFDKSLMENFDWKLLSIVFGIFFIGVITLYSAVTAGGIESNKILCIKQFVWYIIGLLAASVSFIINYKVFEKFSHVIYIVCVGLLVFVLFSGRTAGGSQRWISIGFISIQPSEFIKIAVIIMLSNYYAKRINVNGLYIRELVYPMFIVFIPVVLILKQPDLGTGMMLVLIAGTITVFAKIEKKSFITLFLIGVIALPSVWFVLKPYQRERILTFINPERDPLGAGYHIIQSKIAIGSGILYGKGYLKGTQNALSFLPEQHTDFIFSVLAEEWGFIGAIILFYLFLLLIIRGVNIAHESRDVFGTILCVGVTALIFWQVVINLGMVMGLFPVVGVPLPLISYGGSSVLTIMVCIGILMNVSIRRNSLE